jgi:hypothetical protein
MNNVTYQSLPGDMDQLQCVTYGLKKINIKVEKNVVRSCNSNIRFSFTDELTDLKKHQNTIDIKHSKLKKELAMT